MDEEVIVKVVIKN